MDKNIADIRKEYRLQTLLEKDVDCRILLLNLINGGMMLLKSEMEEVNAMTLATATMKWHPICKNCFAERWFLKKVLFFLPITIAIREKNLWKTQMPVWFFSGKNWNGRSGYQVK